MPDLVGLGQQTLLLALALALPTLGVAAVVGTLMAIVQGATQVQDPTLAHLPRLLAVAAAIALSAAWMGRELSTFAVRCFSGG